MLLALVQGHCVCCHFYHCRRLPGPILACRVCATLAYYICISAAYERVDMTFAYTVMGCAPLLTSLALLALGVNMSVGAWCGVLTLCAGIPLPWHRQYAPWLRLERSFHIPAYFVYHHGLHLGRWPWRPRKRHKRHLHLRGFLDQRPANTRIHFVAVRPEVCGLRPQAACSGHTWGLASMGSYGIKALRAMTLAPIAVVAALRETSVDFWHAAGPVAVG